MHSANVNTRSACESDTVNYNSVISACEKNDGEQAALHSDDAFDQGKACENGGIAEFQGLWQNLR